MAILHWDWFGETRFAKNSAKQIAVAQNFRSGRLEIFYVGTNNDLFHNWQVQPGISDNINWAGETRFAKDSAKQISAAQNHDGRLEIFYVGTNNDLFHNWQVQPDISDNTNWAGESRFPKHSAKQVAVGQNSNYRLEIFYVGTNNELYHNWQVLPSISDNSNWAGETRFAKNSAKQVAVAQNLGGRLEIFYVGTNNELYHNWQLQPGISDNSNWAGETRFAKNSAKQVAVAQNADGRLEIFYVGTNNDLFHNWQLEPGVSDPWNWAGETRFPGDSAKQIAVAQNADGRLEIFYVGTNNELYHNWQMIPSISDESNWAGETRFPQDSAKQVVVAQNSNRRLEIFYVGTNDDLYHNWQVDQNSMWTDLDGAGGSVSTTSPFGSGSNFSLSSNCNPLTDVAVSIEITQDVIFTGHGKPVSGNSISGFTFQLNCFSPPQFKDVAQQYVMGCRGGTVFGQVNNWKVDPKDPNKFDQLINDEADLSSVSGHKMSAGWRLVISLSNDSSGNITGATFLAINPKGNNAGKQSISIGKSNQAPIMGLEMVLVGPGNGESTTLSSGVGSFQYLASSLLSASVGLPPCVQPSSTEETANSLYGPISSDASNVLTQTFSVATPGALLLRRVGPMRPPLTFRRRPS